MSLISLVLAHECLVVEVADTPELRRRGLMGRKELGEQEGMLFVFPDEEMRAFWMRQTYIPLSIAFFDADGNLFQILDMDPAEPDVLYKSDQPAQFALEMPQGWFSNHSISLGSSLQIIGPMDYPQ